MIVGCCKYDEEIVQFLINHSNRDISIMSYRNYINLTEKQLDKPIYRIMSIERLKQVLRDREISLVKPKKWDDPFENALLKSSFSMSSGEKTSFLAKDSVYGQCWTFNRETDAMWRIYSYDIDGVRVTSTPRKLWNALKNSDPKYANIRAFIGKVTYLKKTSLLTRLGQIDILNSNGSGIAESLLFKRNEFRHEAEVRLIYCGSDGNCSSDYYQVPIDPNLLFDKIFFDPRMDLASYKSEKTLIKKLGYKGLINKSALYRAPEGLIFRL